MNNYIDKKTGENIVELEKNFSKINLNSMNVIITTSLAKIQASLNELITSYQNVAKKVKENKTINIDINNTFFKGILDLTPSYLEENLNNMDYIAYWIIDEFTKEENLKPNSIEKKQIYSFSKIIRNLYSSFSATNSSSICYYFYFDSSELFISYPLIYDYESEYLEVLLNYDNYPWCTDEKGKIYTTYKAKCRDYYINIQKAKTSIFDNNIEDYENNRTIFVTEFYQDLTQVKSANIYTMCIQFKEPISEKNAYACADIGQDNLISNFDEINSKLLGYFLVTLVGFNHAFYFPQMIENSLTPSEAIFTNDKTFCIEEKNNFINNIQKLMTSNYIKYSSDNLWDEIYINGKNDTEQYFYFNGEKNYFNIIPVYLENLDGNKEHILSIIYVYNPKDFFEKSSLKYSNIQNIIISEIIIFFLFGTGLLYLIFLSFDILAKFIVISIKNANYMLKGINIGGINRLEYLDYLKNKLEENYEIFDKIINNEKDKNDGKDELKTNNNDNLNIKQENKLNKEKTEIPLIDKENNVDNGKDNIIDVKDDEIDDDIIINQNLKIDENFEENNYYIEQEINFYNFDENLLQNRPSEINHLINDLLELKEALYLTSSDQRSDKIINYSNSSGIFKNFNNKEAIDICQSNIGNLQIQLHKYDKAIYHLALSLQDKKLKKFLNKNLSDELDEGDILLNKIGDSFNKKKKKKNVNKLIKRQENNTKNDFSQKIIGNLINSRYNRLIHSYYKFFSLIQKYKIGAIKGNFMNTSFHTIYYYNKILIQYIFLSYVKNDLIKIGESILDYIEFLIKFKLKTSPENDYILNIKFKSEKNFEDNQKGKYKKKIYDKIIQWFCLFDDYVSHIRNNTSLSDNNSIFENNSDNIISDLEINSTNQSIFLFKINIQKSEFLKGKLALYCHQYNDALFYFIRASKKKSIALDGLIKKKALKHILKMCNIFFQKYEELDINDSNFKEKIIEYEKIKFKNNPGKNIAVLNNNKIMKKNNITFEKELKTIKNCLIKDLNECNTKKEKDVLIIIDFNLYDLNGGIINQNNLGKIDTFIEQTKKILEEYLSNNDKLAVFIYTDNHQIICPLLLKNEIDFENFSKDLEYYKKHNFYLKDNNNNSEIKDSSIIEIDNKEINTNNFSSENSQKDSLYDSISKRSNNYSILNGLINSINYSNNYLSKKLIENEEKYIILFTDLFAMYQINDEKIKNIFDLIHINNEIIFLLVGKNNNLENNEDEILNEIIKGKFKDKSEIIYFENMKKIETILAKNIEIKEDIIFPNEIYKY